MEFEATVVECVPESSDESSSKEVTQYAHRKEEAAPTGAPGPTVLRQASVRDHAVDVGMMDQRLAPGMQDFEKPDPSSEVLRIQGHILKRPAHSAKEQVVDDAWILKRRGREGLRNREYDVSIGHRQHLGLACFEPGLLGTALTFRAVSVSARVV